MTRLEAVLQNTEMLKKILVEDHCPENVNPFCCNRNCAECWNKECEEA